MKKEHVKLKETDREQLHKMLRKGSLKSRTYKRILSLLELDKGQSYIMVESIANLSKASLGKLAKSYASIGLDCLYDSPRPGRPVRIDEEQKSRLAVLSCSEAPNGHSQWSLRLLADKMVELGYCDSMSHTMVGNILKKEN
jgi:transposase